MDEVISRKRAVLNIDLVQFKKNDLFWSIVLGLYSGTHDKSDEYFPASYSLLKDGPKELNKIFRTKQPELLAQVSLTPDDEIPDLHFFGDEVLTEFERKYNVGIIIFSNVGRKIFCTRLPQSKFDRVVPIFNYPDLISGLDRYSLIYNLSGLVAEQIREFERMNDNYNLSAMFLASDDQEFFGRYKGKLTLCLYCLEYTKFGANPHSPSGSDYLHNHNRGDIHYSENCNLSIPPYLRKDIVLENVKYGEIKRTGKVRII